MTVNERAASWYRRARVGSLPPRIVGGVPCNTPRVSPSVTRRAPRIFRCHYCPETFADAEVAFAHLWSHPESDRRKP